MFTGDCEILPPPQRKLWAELTATPKVFVLYGGTALALRLRHRTSEDFDFFSNEVFQPSSLLKTIAYLKHAQISQSEENKLTAIVDREGPVKISFFGGLSLNRVSNPDVVSDNGIQIASLVDVVATKLKTIQEGAQARDYIDIAAALSAGLNLPVALAAAEAIFGKIFNGALSLKALTYFADGDLPALKQATRKQLRAAALSVDLKKLPNLQAMTGIREGNA